MFCSLFKEKLEVEAKICVFYMLIISMFHLFRLFHFSVEQAERYGVLNMLLIYGIQLQYHTGV
jgi:hypothetical protein